MIDFRILGALLRKEVIMMKRNPIIPRLIIGLPVIVLLVIPLVATFDVKNVNVAVVDNDRSQLSRRIIADINSSDVLTVTALSSTYDKALGEVEKGAAEVIVTIPPDFSRIMSPIDVQANGVNATKSMLGMQYVVGSINNTLTALQQESGFAMPQNAVSVIDRYNPTLNFKNYMLPALMVFLLILICGFLPVLNLVSEKETGTIEAMNVTPVGKFTFVLSKLILYWVIGLLVVVIGVVIGRAVYGLWPAGSLGAILLAVILLSLVMSGLGVTVANKSATMLQSIFVMFAFVMIFQLMGGLFTPVQSMPEWSQNITYLIPPRYFNEIMRAVYLKGATIAELWPQYVCLAAFAVLACILAATTYKKRN